MDLQPFAPYLGVAEIILAVALTVLVLLQTKGSSLGSFMGGAADSGGGFRTRRGVEATLHRVTIYCAILFFVCTVLAFLAWGQAG
jgi:preprotein translocase subunit SecG